ncbi:MAG: rhodanese-like domain-containing protein [Euryarchaeota archaeon]|jgi:phage shock protein E|nr:rhodanese-like domain-containing protein [Euryarchaeota archaeon]MBT7413018.1 rhodanese-like domain-containing protein [Euryarchaeota archaeon]|tara:strand:+ start:75 stop:470 length:396 start_codon:yes stop_codon:yes gene_type:complete
MKKKKLFSLIAIILFSGCLSDSSTWERVDAETFNQEINDNEEAFLLDVRTLTEWNDEGHIENATLIPHDNLEEKREQLPENKDDLILLYCRSGNRSQNAAQTLFDMGYNNIIELKSGINGWKSGGYSVVYP